ncbi:DUF4956 domain-containing protein [Desulforegula conservatrix]|uniref:DUF4956 domain-containing protein n=1 Tax=Desulforegula conservatrix TaxID=153026 RepID=UPI0003F7A4F9|nr:DUF4956 domain-containing protein [Desulforegula conservatrix]
MLDMLAFQSSAPNSGLLPIIYTILLSFMLSSVIGVTYIKTFRGLSYSRNYVQAVILIAIIAATIIHAIGDSLARGLGMMGALAIIRFRTTLRDPRDIMFIFASIAAGIGCGVGTYNAAIFGTFGFIMTAFLLYYSQLGLASSFDGMLRFNIENTDEGRHELENLLKKYCRNFVLITLRDMQQGERLDYAYHVKLRNTGESAALVKELPEKIPSVRGVGLMLQESSVEL